MNPDVILLARWLPSWLLAWAVGVLEAAACAWEEEG